ncbi:DUF2264 domain-containing protein [Streptomyces sp. S1D4-11]
MNSSASTRTSSARTAPPCTRAAPHLPLRDHRPLWAGVLADATPLAPGLTRRLASGALKHFAEHGVPDEQGLLSLGWYRPFLPVTQRYSGPASPYWASKAFLGLLLPADHPVWTAPESRDRWTRPTRAWRCPSRAGSCTRRPPTASYAW